MKAIIFGAFGQDGHYLSALLSAKGFDVLKIGRARNPSETDIANFDAVMTLIKSQKPDFIFHLAANSTTRHDVMFENHKIICDGTLNILEAVRIASPQTKVFISGSGLQFVNNSLPIKESDDFEARDPYAVSRIHSVYAARYFRTLGIKVYVGYFFNHDSPFRSERHVAKKITAFVKRISLGANEILEIGDVSVTKEWGYAGDIVNGIYSLVSQDIIFEANIATGKGYTIEDWLEISFGFVGKDWRSYVRIQDNFRSDYKVLVSDPSLIMSLGWTPSVTIEGLSSMMIGQQ